MKPRSYPLWILSLIPLLTACPGPPPVVIPDDLGPDCQSIKAITITPPCTNAYPGLSVTASGYDQRGTESTFEWRLYLQKDTLSSDTLQQAKIFSGSDQILILDSLVRKAPKLIVSVVPQYWRCTKRDYFSLVKRQTSDGSCPVWTSQKIQ